MLLKKCIPRQRKKTTTPTTLDKKISYPLDTTINAESRGIKCHICFAWLDIAWLCARRWACKARSAPVSVVVLLYEVCCCCCCTNQNDTRTTRRLRAWTTRETWSLITYYFPCLLFYPSLMLLCRVFVIALFTFFCSRKLYCYFGSVSTSTITTNVATWQKCRVTILTFIAREKTKQNFQQPQNTFISSLRNWQPRKFDKMFA